jgi:hypothetical protein
MDINNKVCRFCGKKLTHTFVDLGLSPVSNEYISDENYGGVKYFIRLR